MKVFVIGAGLIGARIVSTLHADHDVTVVDLDPGRLKALAQHFDVATAQGNAASGRDLLKAGIANAELVITCTSRDESNLVAGAFARSVAPHAKTIVRTSSADYVEIWREGRLDVDAVVSSEVETARAVTAAIGLPAARYTDTFAEGRVQVVELDIPETAGRLVTRKLSAARLPADSRVAGIIRKEQAVLVRGDVHILPGDRLVVVGSPRAAREWCELIADRRGEVRDIVVYGAQELGAAIARTLVEQSLNVRVIEPHPGRARALAERLHAARVYNCDGLDPEFLQREGIGRLQAAVFAMRDDAANLFAAAFAHTQGVGFRIALAHSPISPQIYEDAGIDAVVDPLLATSEEIVRFAHDPRTHQMAMLEHDRFVVLDLTTRADSALVGVPLREMPQHGAQIGAVVRNGEAIFPHGADVLEAGDRVIVFTEAARAPLVEREL